jgi:hypothetical protein
MDENIKIATANIRSLKKIEKILYLHDIFEKNKIDILFIQRLLFNPDRVYSENVINRNFFNSRPLISIRTCKISFFNRLKIRIKPLVNRTYPLTYVYALLHNLFF